jgi:hypothetical protein
MCRWTTAISFVILAGSAGAQPEGFRGSVAGFVYSPASRSVRPLLGVRGATSIGSPLVEQVGWASVAPGGRAALAVKDGHLAVLLGLSTLAPYDAASDGLIDAADRVAWSRDGRFAALYSSASGLLQRIRFGAPSPTADPPLDTSSLGRLTALAVNAIGGRIAFGTDAGRLYLIENGQSFALISSTIAQPSAAAFDDSGQHLYALDATTQRIIEFNSGAGETEFTTLDGADPAVGLALSANGRFVLVTGASKTVRVYEASSRSLINTIPLDFTPSRMERLETDPVFLLNGDNDGEYLLVLDARETPSVYFIPAASEERL